MVSTSRIGPHKSPMEPAQSGLSSPLLSSPTNQTGGLGRPAVPGHDIITQPQPNAAAASQSLRAAPRQLLLSGRAPPLPPSVPVLSFPIAAPLLAMCPTPMAAADSRRRVRYVTPRSRPDTLSAHLHHTTTVTLAPPHLDSC